MSDQLHKNVKFIKDQLNEMSVSYLDLAKMTKIPLHTIYRIFSGKRDLGLKEQDKILKALNMQNIDLLEGDLSMFHVELIHKIAQLNQKQVAEFSKTLNSLATSKN